MKILLIKSERLMLETLGMFLISRGHLIKTGSRLKELENESFDFMPDVLIIEKDLLLEEIGSYNKKLEKINSCINKTIVLVRDIKVCELFDIFNVRNIHFLHYDDSLNDLLSLLIVISENDCTYNVSANIKTLSNGKFLAFLLLTTTERIILKLINSGMSNQEIAEKMCRSSDTIKNHRKNIKAKLNIKGGKKSFIGFLN